MSDAPELKPCPFCGQSNTIQPSRLYLECLEFGCYGPDAEKGQARNDEYAPHRAWNTQKRKSPAQWRGLCHRQVAVILVSISATQRSHPSGRASGSAGMVTRASA